MSKVIVHIDLNAFFVRAEEIKDPSLEGKAVAIGHEGRSGIVSTCSYEARKYGVSSGMPMFKAVALCPTLIIKPADFHFYRALSEEFIHFVRNYTKEVEIASIDEVYADFTKVVEGKKDVEGFFKEFQAQLFAKTKLKCSIGVAPTKFLAKMGSDYRKPMGLTIIRRRDVRVILYPLSLDKMFGVGKKTAPRLESIGIHTIGDLAVHLNENEPMTYDILGKSAFVLKDWVNGYGSDEIVSTPDDPKSIGNSSTLDHDTANFEEIKQMYEILVKEVSDRAKKENKLGSTIQIVVKDIAFKSYNKSITFPNPTNQYSFLLEKTLKLYEENFSGMTIRLVGVTLQNLIDPMDMAIQMTLFDYQEHEKESTTKLLINELNRKFNKKDLLKRASEVKKNGSDRRD